MAVGCPLFATQCHERTQRHWLRGSRKVSQRTNHFGLAHSACMNGRCPLYIFGRIYKVWYCYHDNSLRVVDDFCSQSVSGLQPNQSLVVPQPSQSLPEDELPKALPSIPAQRKRKDRNAIPSHSIPRHSILRLSEEGAKRSRLDPEVRQVGSECRGKEWLSGMPSTQDFGAL